MKKLLPIIFFYLLVSNSIQAQSNQQKAEGLVTSYLINKTNNSKINPSFKLNSIQVLRSPFTDTKQYNIYQHKIDSLKIAGRKIDARIAKMKTTAELDQAKKESYRLSHELVVTSDQLIKFMTTYKGQQIGWMIKNVYSNKTARKKTFYLNLALTKVDSVR